VIFLDASAIVGILAAEADAATLLDKLEAADSVGTSALAVYEAALGLARLGGVDADLALELVELFLPETGATVVAIDFETARGAIDAFLRFGKGRHKAALNMGDCFAYAAARRSGAALLCKGADFPRTDALLA